MIGTLLFLFSSFFLFHKDVANYYGRPKGCSSQRILLNLQEETYCELEVRKLDSYVFLLKYNFDRDVIEFKKFISNINRDHKDQTLSIKIYDINSDILLNEVINMVDMKDYSQNSEGMFLKIYELNLEPGKYNIVFKNSQSIPELMNVNTEIVFSKSYEGK